MTCGKNTGGCPCSLSARCPRCCVLCSHRSRGSASLPTPEAGSWGPVADEFTDAIGNAHFLRIFRAVSQVKCESSQLCARCAARVRREELEKGVGDVLQTLVLSESHLKLCWLFVPSGGSILEQVRGVRTDLGSH